MMNTHVETNCTTKVGGTELGRFKRVNTELDVGKKKWLQKYSHRLLRLWLQQQTPLGVTPMYIGQIEEDLAKFYDEPLKRMFIETTYD